MKLRNIKAGRLVPSWLEVDSGSASRVPSGRATIRVGDNGVPLTIRYRRRLRSGFTRFYF